ncbi:MAG: hypothetical protein HQL96_01535 [Magnetococcales bacterium]|nr:hypothetical protein [Magnetococcales bacterium]
MLNQQNPQKGQRLEELLRSYFLKAGYYVVRGVPFVYEGCSVTDIDLWLYGRSTYLSREIALVDVKNKKTPQAIERIFWVQGLRIATKATNAIVATTERRQEIKNFGRDLGVLVLDGVFLSNLKKLADADDPNATRLSDEEFMSKINEYALNKVDGNWRGRMVHSKSLLAKSLSFDSCNDWLDQGKFFAEQFIINGIQRETALRCLYLVCSFIAIGVDFCTRDLVFNEQSERNAFVKDGFTFGSKGSIGLKKLLDVAMGLVEEYATGGQTISQQIKISIESRLSQMNTSIIGDFFSKTDVSRTLFNVAREFEQLAMARKFTSRGASTELRSMLFCLLDYWGIKRVMFSEMLESVEK